MNKFIVVAMLMMVAAAAAAPQSYPSEPSAKPSYDEAPMPYSFDWNVKDDESKNDYGHKEISDGKVVTGSYRVVLPDGRTQIVTYKADENGYVADVKYEGEAQYPTPEYKPASKY
ncbi:pro-resilin-like isoform X1 [Daphnia carinata]|uniref:pro-resilin-like isoform X1 n=2 Tax=Daphnia carinata TaxID=120202 RepID=UPI00257A3276|nr:pro-resilin-like isoform X1 [Daphnia carinata]